jgi:peptide/nickel transport system ATP-binding protein
MNRMSRVADHDDPVSGAGRALLDVHGLRITSRIGGRRRMIVSGMDLALAPGETVGIVGESGSGKSMTARAILGLLPPGLSAQGTVRYQGHNLLEMPERALARMRGADIGLILQDPYTMLNPLLRCGKHIEDTLRQRDKGWRARRAHHDEALRRLEEVGISDPSVADRYPFQLSGGMRQRVGIAAALARDPRILVADEPTTALDVTTQKESLALLKSLQETRNMGLILITHDLRIAFSMCDRVYVLYAGSLLEVGTAAAVEAEPLHPYTLGLLLSEPPGTRRVSRLVAIEGTPSAADDVVDRCAFAPRCRWKQEQCERGKPPLADLGGARQSACVRIDEIRGEIAELRRAAERPAEPAASVTYPAPLARVSDLRKVFDPTSGRAATGGVQALAGVCMEIGEGESVALVGESGSGKTTLGRCLVGLETPTSGEITIDGVTASDYGSLSTEERRRLRRTVQMIFQDPYTSLNPSHSIGFTLREALRVGHEDTHDLNGLASQLLERVGLPATYRARKPVALSGGERQRVAIARALAVRPQLLVCDEPVSALDVSVQAQILNLFKQLRDELGVAYLFISHDLAVVRQVVDRVYVLYRGEVVESGPVDHILDSPQHPYTARLVASVPRSDADWLSSS